MQIICQILLLKTREKHRIVRKRVANVATKDKTLLFLGNKKDEPAACDLIYLKRGVCFIQAIRWLKATG
jgi:hypothetical protein